MQERRPLRYADPADEAEMLVGDLPIDAEAYATELQSMGVPLQYSAVRLEPVPDDPVIDELNGRWPRV